VSGPLAMTFSEQRLCPRRDRFLPLYDDSSITALEAKEVPVLSSRTCPSTIFPIVRLGSYDRAREAATAIAPGKCSSDDSVMGDDLETDCVGV
jgi:hypothetical protein